MKYDPNNITTKDKIEILEMWIEKLESGVYKQTTGTLCEKMPDGTFGYCCLGVLAKELGMEPPAYTREDGKIDEGPTKIYDQLKVLVDRGISYGLSRYCSDKNDKGFTFQEIVDTEIKPKLEDLKEYQNG